MPTGLIRRTGGRYSTRRVIPLDLQKHYGKREIVIALGTADPSEARRRHALTWVEIDKDFAERRMGIAPTAIASPDDVTDIGQRTLSALRKRRDIAQAGGQLGEFMAANREEIPILQAMLVGDFDPQGWSLGRVEGHRNARVALATGDGTIAANSQPATASPATSSADAITIEQALDRWAQERKPAARTIRRTRNILDRFEAAVGTVTTATLTRRHVLDFKDHLVASGQSPANINVMIPMLGTVFNYAVANDLMAHNPASKIGVADPRRAKEKGRAYEPEELTALFDGPVHRLGARPPGGGGEAAFWLPLLALFTGARQTELGQLHPDDIAHEAYLDADGMSQSAWVIRVVENKARGQRVKNDGSERRIPVHADLMTLGFLAMVNSARDEKRDRIFPLIVDNSVGELMGNWSKWFGRYRRKECGLDTKSTPFHGLRHTFKHLARLAGIPTEVHNALTGHETGDVADAYGALSYPLHPLVEAMKRYRVPDFNLPARPAG